MLGIIFTILGIYTSYQLWGDYRGLAIITIIATLYQASSLNEMAKEERGLMPKDRWQTIINLLSSLIIIGMFISSFLV